MKRQTVYMEEEEYRKIKYASMKDNRPVSNFLKVAGIKRSETIITNLEAAGINTIKEMKDLIIDEEQIEEDEL